MAVGIPAGICCAILAAVSASIAPATPAHQRLRIAAQLEPAPRQMAWQREELTAFIHFGPNTYTNREWGTGREDPRVFNPTDLDSAQWARTLKEAGFDKVILVAKHHDGFALWPSRYTAHSVKSSRWRNGKGDVVGSFVRSARKYGLRVGLYLSPADLHEALPGGTFADGSTPRWRTIPTFTAAVQSKRRRIFHFRLDDYNAYYLNQLYELLTQYGPVEEVWFDGANPLKGSGRVERYDYQAWYAMVRALQPGAVIFPIDVNWVGNEMGRARLSQWSVVPLSGPPMPDQSTHVVDPDDANLGSAETIANPKTRLLRWMPSECDVPLERGWFWHPNAPPKPLSELQTIYLDSIGRNCQLLLDVPPDRRGRFDDADTARIAQFGAWVRHTFARDLASGGELDARTGASTGAFTLKLARPQTFSLIVLQEEITRGQRVSRFSVETWNGRAWVPIAQGTTIGYKRVLSLRAPVRSALLRVRVLSARDRPRLAAIGLYR